MVRVEEIVDRESFEAWLEELPKACRAQASVAISTRAALKAFPFWVAELETDWARVHQVSPFPIVRSILFAQAFCHIGFVGEKVFEQAAAGIGAVADHGMIGAHAYEAAYIAQCAVNAAAEPENWHYLAANVASAVGALGTYNILWRETQLDCFARVDTFEQRLWSEHPPSEIATAWTTGRTWMQARPGYGFWIRWYEAALAGRPLTGDWQSHWQLMYDVALIDPADWDKGAEHVAGVIDLISQKQALQRDFAQIKRALEHEIFNAETLGQHRDNLPDDLPPSRVVQYRAQLREVLEELEAVEAALKPPVPDAEVLEEATGRLRAVWAKIKQYPLAAGFVVLMGAGVTGAVGQLGVRGMDWVIDEGVPALLRQIKDIKPKSSPLTQPSKEWEKPPVDV